MNADDPYSSISRAKKREKLIALIERRKNKKRTPVRNRDKTNSKIRVKENMKLKKLNSRIFKKLFRMRKQKTKVLKDVNYITAKDSCSGSRHKKQRLCSGPRSGELTDFEEYWVPAHLSCTQMKQYCSVLASILESFSSSSRIFSLHDILTRIQKCCDHPYLVDPTLRDSLKNDSLINPLEAEINVSGKMQLLDKLLLEIKRRGLKALVLFQSSVDSENLSYLLDDLVYQRFGEYSYVYIRPRNTLSKSVNLMKKKSLKMFNNASERFICLLDYRACHSSVTLSRVDVVILFNSVGNLVNDIKALQRITIDSPCERLPVFRLYSTFTVEEKALILAKKGKTVSHITSSVCHQMLAWGASYLFQTVQKTGFVSFIDELVDELSSVLSNTRVKTGPTNRSLISKAHMQNGAYSDSILLYGELETHTKESCSVDEFLVGDSPSVFWSNLVKESQHRPENLCSRLTKRVRKSTQVWFEDENPYNATTTFSVRTKPRSKRKVNKKVNGKKWAGIVCKRKSLSLSDAQVPILPFTSISDSIALNPRTNESQQSQTDQPPANTCSNMPLETEIERIQKERELIKKSHQEKKSMLLSECEKEISKVKKKYDELIHDSETSLTKNLKILEDYLEFVDSNKLLAEFFSQNWHDNLNLDASEDNLKRTKKKQTNKRTQKDHGPLIVPNIPASALARIKNPRLISGPTTFFSGHSLAGSRLRAPPPHLRANKSLFPSFPNRPAIGEPFLEPLPTLSTS